MREAYAAVGVLIGEKTRIMRKIDSIIVHCSATKAGMDFGVRDIDRRHRERGMDGVGYHYVIRLDGTVEEGRKLERVGAHCLKWNERSVGICYIGGLDEAGLPADTRTDRQKEAMRRLIGVLRRRYEISAVMGHRDTSPDLNGDGVIGPEEFIKWCPCFDVRKWLVFLLFPLLWSGCGSSRSTRESRTEEMRAAAVAADSRRMTHAQKTEEEMTERVDEHIEETVVFWETDTTGWDEMKEELLPRRLYAVKRRIVDRTGSGRRKEVTDSSFGRNDSVWMTADSAVKTENREEKTKARTGGWWKIGGLVGMVVLGMLFFRKIFLVDNQ